MGIVAIVAIVDFRLRKRTGVATTYIRDEEMQHMAQESSRMLNVRKRKRVARKS